MGTNVNRQHYHLVLPVKGKQNQQALNSGVGQIED